MEQFYKLVKKEITTEKSQKSLDAQNTRTFITLPSVRKNEVESSFVKTFGFKPEKINSLTFLKAINNRKTRAVRRVKMKKFFITLPKGKELVPVSN